MMTTIYGLRSGTPTTGSLPVSSGDPTAITPDAGCVNIVVRADGEFSWVWAASAGAGATAMGTASHGRYSAGAYNFSPRGQKSSGTQLLLCIRSTGAAVSNGLTYFQEFDNSGQ